MKIARGGIQSIEYIVLSIELRKKKQEKKYKKAEGQNLLLLIIYTN